MAGICRTDRYAAHCGLGCAPGRILGHEFAGTVMAMGEGVQDLALGQRVGVMPRLGCGRCVCCVDGRSEDCESARFLGVDLDGAFAEEVVVPRSAVHPIPDGLSWREAAYLEPVAAAMAVLNAPLPHGVPGLVLGRGRIARLTARILAAHDFGDIVVASEATAKLSGRTYAFVIETNAAERGLTAALRLVKPGGLLVLKSRPKGAVQFDLTQAVQQRLTLVGVHYGPFTDAIDLLARGRLEISDLFGPAYTLSDASRAFAEDDGKLKRFLVPDEFA